MKNSEMPRRSRATWAPIVLLGLALLGLLALRGLGTLGHPDGTAAWPRGDTPAALRPLIAWLAGDAALWLLIGAFALHLLAAFSGHIIHAMHRRRAPPADESAADAAIRSAFERAALRFRGIRPWLYNYVEVKYWLEPSYPELARRIPPDAFLVDLGTGMGLLPIGLAEYGGTRALGIEWDPVKARAGQYAARDLPGIEIRAGDILNEPLPPCDAITLIDVLHYHEPARQDALLARAAAALRPGGQLLIRDIDAGQIHLSRSSRLSERLNVFFGWNRSADIHFCNMDQLTIQLQALGLTVERVTMATDFLPGNVLLCAVKK